MGINYFLLSGVFAGLFAAVVALQCFQCGQYNDGVGSITPCINETHMKLKDCPRREHLYCIKYISEGSTVRDCVPKCTERESKGVCSDEMYCKSRELCSDVSTVSLQCLGCISEGTTDYASTNSFRITKPFWQGASRPTLENINNTAPDAFENCMHNFMCSIITVENFMLISQKDCNMDGKIDCHDFAAIHLFGYFDCGLTIGRDPSFERRFGECQSRKTLHPKFIALLEEDWGTKTFCCSDDGCNGSITYTPNLAFVILLLAMVLH